MGVVNLGLLIKAVPASRKGAVPARLDRSVPLVGFDDIYRFLPDKVMNCQALDRGPIQKYDRRGTAVAAKMGIEIDGADLGRSNPLRIPLSVL